MLRRKGKQRMKLPEGLQERQILCLMQFGSQLYGTATPESDVDYKGVYMPTKEQILLQRTAKTYSISPKKEGEGIKNNPGDVDMEIYSLPYFLELAKQGQTVALDMLHCALYSPCMERASLTWKELRENRSKFYTKSLDAFVGYARKQAAKYGIKGSRLNAAQLSWDYLSAQDGDTKLREVWEGLPFGEHIDTIYTDVGRFYQVCGKQFQDTVTCSHAANIIGKFLEEYGARARLAASNEGVDWKAVSHALRAAHQLNELYLMGDIRFPLKGREYIKLVKQGKVPWSEVQDDLEYLMAKVERLAAESSYPEKVDSAYWDAWLYEQLLGEVLHGLPN